jgi:hypothetical protein
MQLEGSGIPGRVVVAAGHRRHLQLPSSGEGAAAVRVMLVVNKQELKKMLDREGLSLDGMVSLMRKD